MGDINGNILNESYRRCARCCELYDELCTMTNELLLTQTKLRSIEEELNNVQEHLKKYTAPERSRAYYQTHKDELKQDPEYKKQRSEINKRAYQKRKQKENDTGSYFT